MENRAIGEILKNRIKEKGYKQEDFAYELGISYETLKNYLNGTSAYPLECLIKASELLDCSFDYLLGYSKATKNENHILVNELGLSNEAIERIKSWKNSESADIRDNMLLTLDKIICKEDFIFLLALFILSNKRFSELSDKVGDILSQESLEPIGLDIQKTMYISMIMELLGELREENKGDITISGETIDLINNMSKKD